MKKVKHLGIFALLGWSIFSAYLVVRLVQENKKIKDELPYFMPGERINYFDLISMDNNAVDVSVLKNSKKPSLIFIFTTPCSPCNKNIVFWNKLAEIMKDRVSIYGIILDDVSQAYSFSESSKSNFGIYVPKRIDEFKNNMRLKLNIEQTIICEANKVKFAYIGVLDINELSKFLDAID
jgi:hypothetical protein